MQMGYSASYIGAGTVDEVDVDVVHIPSVNMSLDKYSCGPVNCLYGWIGFMLNTGDLNNCGGFMQDIVQFNSNSGGTTWTEYYMNGNSQCGESSFGSTFSIPKGHDVLLKIYLSGTNTEYYVEDISTGTHSTQQTSNLGTWNKNSFQTMTEATDIAMTVGASSYQAATFHVQNGNNYYTYNIASSSAYTQVSGSYTGICSITPYSLGSWSNTFYGYDQALATVQGYCPSSAGGRSGHYGNTNYMYGGADGYSGYLSAPNSGDVSTVILGFNEEFVGGISIDGYSYNNNAGAYYSYVQVWVTAYNDSWPANPIYSATWSPSSSNSPNWIFIGDVQSGIQFIKIEVSYNSGYSAKVYIDAVNLGPSWVTQVYSSRTGHTGGGTVTNTNGLVGGPDGNYVNLHAPNGGDSAYITGYFGQTVVSWVCIAAFGYSYNNNAGAYYSSVSPEWSFGGSTWVVLPAATWNPSAGNVPYWNVESTGASNMRYVTISVNDSSGYSGNVYLDAVGLVPCG